MKLIETVHAEGHVLCQDLTQIIPGQFKGARFRKGHVVTKEDIPVLLSMGKEHLYVWEMEEGMVHENDAASRLARLCRGDHMSQSEAKEGKIELTAEIDGLFLVDGERLKALNRTDDVMVATRHGGTAVKAGDKLCGTRCIPLVMQDALLRQAEAAVGSVPLLSLRPWTVKTAAIVVTGSEVKKGLVEDKFSPVVIHKLEAFGIKTVSVVKSGDGVENVKKAILDARGLGVGLILCTGGMSVDADDNTPGAIKSSGVKVVTYGAPVLPGAMFMLGYFDDGVAVAGLPGCVMFAPATVFDLALPYLASSTPLDKETIISWGEGGMCLGCKPCHWPDCPFGK